MKRRADQLLVERGVFESRARAQAAIAAGLVSANGAVVRKASEMLPADAEIATVPRAGQPLAPLHLAMPR